MGVVGRKGAEIVGVLESHVSVGAFINEIVGLLRNVITFLVSSDVFNDAPHFFPQLFLTLLFQQLVEDYILRGKIFRYLVVDVLDR